MGVVVFGLVLLNLLFIGLFQFVKPEHPSKNALMVFNICTYVVALIVGGAAMARTFSWEVSVHDEELREALALYYGLGLFAAVIFVMFLFMPTISHSQMNAERISYGPEDLQFGDLRLPDGEGPFPVIMIIHGGCWLGL